MPALPSPAAELARLLSEKAERVCRHYLSTGRRCGHYWALGDVSEYAGTLALRPPARPEFGKGAAGKWCDAATGEHGDLLDLIRLNCGFESLRETLDEARSFLRVPRPDRSRERDASRRGAARGKPLGVSSAWADPSLARPRRPICARGITATSSAVYGSSRLLLPRG